MEHLKEQGRTRKYFLIAQEDQCYYMDVKHVRSPKLMENINLTALK